MSSLAKKIVIMLSILVFAYVATGYVRARSSNDQAFRALTVYSEVLNHVSAITSMIPTCTSDRRSALHGLVDSLDPQSGYLSPLEYNDFKEKSANKAKARAGVALTKRFGYIAVLSVLPDSPAAKSRPSFWRHPRKNRGFTTVADGHRPGASLAKRRPRDRS